MNTSATGGPLTPSVVTPPLTDGALDSVIQAWLVGLTALPGAMVRPRWQPRPPVRPEATVDWASIGVVHTGRDNGPYIAHVGTGVDTDHDLYTRHQDITVRVSFYGPNAGRYAEMFADGVYMPQNQILDMPIIDTGDIITAPELINQTWFRRCDIDVVLRRRVVRRYAVLSLAGARVEIVSDSGPGAVVVLP